MRRIDRRNTIDLDHKDNNFYDSDWRQRMIVETVGRRATRVNVAMDTHHELFHFYGRTTSQTYRCPCWRDIDPAANCTLCYGLGFLPPYKAQGFHTETVLHAEYPTNAVNMFVDWSSDRGTPAWKLRDTAYNGYLQSEWISIQPNKAESLSVWTTLSPEEDKFFTIEFEYSAVPDTWWPIDRLNEFLPDALKIRFRVTASRDELTEEVPEFPALSFRYNVVGAEFVKGTMPNWNLSGDRVPEGLIELIDNSVFIATGKIEEVKVNDFFEHIKTGTRFRVISIDNSEWKDEVMEWRLQVRRVQPTELVSKIV